jgi:DNA polymerase-3 subunit chi
MAGGGRELANGAGCLMSVEGADVVADEVVALSRTCILFDGGDDAAVETARAQWRALTGAGLRAEYWSQAEGPWRRQAEAN